MSEIVSFRLSKANPREAQAIEILEAWFSKGYGVRHVIVEALLKLSDPSPESIENKITRELNVTLDQVKRLLEKIEDSGYLGVPEQHGDSARSNLANDFIASVRKTVRSGIKPS